MWLTDPQTNQKSVTVTLFTYGFLVCILKLLVSGISISSLHVGSFSGADFALAVGALGGIYAARKHSDNITKGSSE